MVKCLWVTVLAIALLLLGGSAFAASSLEGPTGIVNVPSTAVEDPGKGELALTWQDLDQLEGAPLDNRMVVRGLYGVAPKWEVGALWNKVQNSEDIKIWGANVKYQIMREPEQQLGLAVGAGYSNFDFDLPPDLKWTRYYAVASKKLSTASEYEDTSMGEVTGLIGVVGDRVKVEGDTSETDTNIMLGVEALSRDGTYLGLDWRPKWKDVGDSIFSIVARRNITPQIGAELGWTNSLGPFGADKKKIFVGIAYTFGTESEQYYW
jgi:hypothetical protein